MDKFTAENAIYITDDGPVDVAKMSREQLLRLVIELMNQQDQARDRHAHEREMLAGLNNYKRWRL